MDYNQLKIQLDRKNSCIFIGVMKKAMLHFLSNQKSYRFDALIIVSSLKENIALTFGVFKKITV